MEADEVLGWKYYLASEPRCWKRIDYQSAQITQAIYQILTSFSGSKNKQVTLDQCILKFIDGEEMEAKRKRDLVKQGMALMQMMATNSKMKGKVKGLDKLKEDIKKLTSET